VLRALTDESLEQRVRPGGRSAGRLAWQVTVSIPQIAKEANIPGVEGSMDDDAIPSRASEIADAYERAAGATKNEWIGAVTSVQANLVREVTHAQTSAARELVS